MRNSNCTAYNLVKIFFGTVLGMSESLLCDQAAGTMCDKDDLTRFCLASFSLPYELADQAFGRVRESTI